MDLYQLIALFGPAAFATILHIKKNENNKYPIVLIYLSYLALVNGISFVIMSYIFRQPDLLFNAYFTAKYIILGFGVAIVSSIITNVMIKNNVITVNIKRKNKKNEKK